MAFISLKYFSNTVHITDQQLASYSPLLYVDIRLSILWGTVTSPALSSSCSLTSFPAELVCLSAILTLNIPHSLATSWH